MYAFVQDMHRSQHDEVLVFSLLTCGGGTEGVQGKAVSSPPHQSTHPHYLLNRSNFAFFPQPSTVLNNRKTTPAFTPNVFFFKKNKPKRCRSLMTINCVQLSKAQW